MSTFPLRPNGQWYGNAQIRYDSSRMIRVMIMTTETVKGKRICYDCLNLNFESV